MEVEIRDPKTIKRIPDVGDYFRHINNSSVYRRLKTKTIGGEVICHAKHNHYYVSYDVATGDTYVTDKNTIVEILKPTDVMTFAPVSC